MPPQIEGQSVITEPTIIAREEHGISRSEISTGALRVLDTLKEAGFEAYLVGGGVRDLLLGLHPKDYDVATEAHPEQIKEVFGRQCRLIGRRFRLAHVRVGREIVEVATFRGTGAEPSDDGFDELLDSDEDLDEMDDEVELRDDADFEADDEAHDSARADSGERVTVNGRILRDNVYGTLEEDVWRRDFTANCLYFDVANETVLDFVGGMADIESKTLRLIGDAQTRYREDPVRMLRALRFAAKLDFRIATESERAIGDCANLLADIPPARLYDETLKLFMGGHGLKSYAILKRYRLLEFICPETAACLEDDDIGGTAERFVMQALENTDTRIADGKPVTPAFLFAALLWEPVVRDTQAYVAQGIGEQAAIESAGVDVIARQIEHVSLPRRFALVAREIWGFQPRLLQRRGQRTAQLLSRPRFRAAYDFLLLRAQAGENDVQDYADWWTQFQAAGESERQDLLTQPAPAQESRGTESKASAGAPRTARGGRSGRGKGRRTEAKQGRPPKEKSQASRGQSKGQAKGAGKANANGKPKTRDAAAGQSSAEKAEKSPKAAKADGRTEAASADGARKRRRRRRPRRPAESAAAAQ